MVQQQQRNGAAAGGQRQPCDQYRPLGEGTWSLGDEVCAEGVQSQVFASWAVFADYGERGSCHVIAMIEIAEFTKRSFVYDL